MAEPQRDLGSDSHQYVQPAEREVVLRRVETVVLTFLRGLASDMPDVSPFFLKTTVFEETSDNDDNDSRGESGRRVDIADSKARSLGTYLRIWKILGAVYSLLQSSDTAITQRELYYCLIADCPAYAQTQQAVADSIRDVVSLLQCTRYSLGVQAASRGSVAGHLRMRPTPDSPWIDCLKQGSEGCPVTGDIALLKSMEFAPNARYILIVEKDAIFQRLYNEGICDKLPCVMVTGKGFPDLATRVLVHTLSCRYPAIMLLGLVDMNPAGLSIICTYKFGSARMALESPQYACDVQWLGLRPSDINRTPSEALLPLTPRDRGAARGLMSAGKLRDYPRYEEELKQMVDNGYKADLESIVQDKSTSLSDFVVEKLLSGDYI